MGKSATSNINKKSNTQKALSGRSSLQILSKLCSLPLSAVVHDASVWLTVPERVAEILHEYALGSSDGGPTTALHTAVKLSQLTGTILQLSETGALVSLRLSPEEAIFLAQATDKVCFYHKTTGHLCLEDTWRMFVGCSSSFVQKYIAYHHYRSKETLAANASRRKGWIPRSGLQYGADLVLYEQHPSHVHSTMCVVIVPMAPPASYAEQSPTLTPHGTDGALSWHDIEGINRLCVRVGKKLMLLYVQPQHQDVDLSTPACLDNFAVSESTVDRWVPEASINLM